MNQLKTFTFESQEVRTLLVNGEPHFVANDVAKTLGYSNPRDALSKHVDKEDKGVAKCDTLGGKQNLTIINESGLYSLILSSKLPTAKKFKRWVTSEVLPAIRKHGGYLTPEKIEEALLNPDTIIRLATDLKREREGRLIAEQRVAELAPKASYTDKVLKCPGLIAVKFIAKDYGMSPQAFNNLLHKLGIQYKQGKTWLLYAKYQDRGWTQSTTHPIDGGKGVAMHTKWTQKGRLELYQELKKHGIYPLIERLEMEDKQ